MRSAMAILATSALLASCGAGRPGTATKYRPSYIFGGYSEKQIEPGVWKVTGRSNGIAERGFSQSIAAYRAGEVIKAAGFRYMQVIDQKGQATSFGIGYGPPTHQGGEYLELTVRGANGPEQPADCRAKKPEQCFTIEVERMMARERPLLHLDEPAP